MNPVFVSKYLDTITTETPTGIQTGLRCALHLATFPYRAIIQARNWGYNHHLIKINQVGCPVISVGNITMGGTGKTPMVHFLTETLLKKDYRVAILSRGYKRNDTANLPLVVSNGVHVLSNQKEAGDEPYLLARKNPGAVVIVDANRVRAGLSAIQRFKTNMIILDDGFSHRNLYRDLDLVMIDVLNPFGYGHLIPRGLLREPISALRRADAIILTRTCHNKEYPEIQEMLERYQIKQPVFRFSLCPTRLTNLSTNKETLLDNPQDKWIACSGIGQPKSFANTLQDIGLSICEHVIFPDHHPYKPIDIEYFRVLMKQNKARGVITTEKDAVKIIPLLKPIDTEWFSIGIELLPDTPSDWEKFLSWKLTPFQPN